MADTGTARATQLLVACGGSFVAFLDVTITNLALPAVGRDFGDPAIAHLSWIVTLYAAVFAALLAPAGRLADVVGRRRLFLAGMAVFTLGSLGAAVSTDLITLLVARGVQGLGAALLLPASLGLVLASTTPERRLAAIGLWSASAAAAAALGPALGGVLVDTLSWRSLFCFNLPVCAGLALATLRVPADAGSGARRPDAAGTAVLGAGVLGLVLGITQSSRWGWSDPATAACLVAGVALCAAAVLRSARHESPAIATHLWRSRTYVAANAVSFLFGGVLFAWLLLGVLYLTAVWQYSELRAGFAMTPGALVAACVGIGVSRLARAVRPRALVMVGGGLIAVCGVCMGLSLTSQPRFVLLWLPVGCLVGAGMGAVSVGVSSAAALSAPPRDFAAATGLNVAIRQIGGAVGVAVMASVLSVRAHGAPSDPYRHVYLLCAVTAAAVAVVGGLLVLPPRPAASTPSRATLPATR